MPIDVVETLLTSTGDFMRKEPFNKLFEDEFYDYNIEAVEDYLDTVLKNLSQKGSSLVVLKKSETQEAGNEGVGEEPGVLPKVTLYLSEESEKFVLSQLEQDNINSDPENILMLLYYAGLVKTDDEANKYQFKKESQNKIQYTYQERGSNPIELTLDVFKKEDCPLYSPKCKNVLKQLVAPEAEATTPTSITQAKYIYKSIDDESIDSPRLTEQVALIVQESPETKGIQTPKIYRVPRVVLYLDNLLVLILSGIGLSYLPSDLYKLINLFILDLSNNNIRSLPESICSLAYNLAILDISGNILCRSVPGQEEMSLLLPKELVEGKINRIIKSKEEEAKEEEAKAKAAAAAEEAGVGAVEAAEAAEKPIKILNKYYITSENPANVAI